MASKNGGIPFTDNQLARLVRGSASQVWDTGRGIFGVRQTATEAWSRLEGAFVHRVARALNAMQIPTARDVHELNDRVAALQRAVIALERRAAQAALAKPRDRARGRTGARKKPAARSGKKTAARGRTKAGS